ncbi:mechanosensitive ion channel family protein [candidate division KSB1 bacterium]
MASVESIYSFLTGPGRLFLFLSIIALTFLFERLVRILLNRYFKKSSKHIKVDPTAFAFFKHLISALIYLMGLGAAVYSIPSFRTLSISIFASAGVLAVVLGFAAQKAFSNVISGIFIAIFKPFRVGDVIKFSHGVGTVEDINLRHTIIRNFENKRFIVPNSVIGDETIENYNIEDPKVCKWVEFGISYDSDVDKAMKIMREESERHPECIDNRTKDDIEGKLPKVAVRVVGFGDSSVNLRAWVWADNPPSAFRVGCDLNKSIKKRFDKEGIEIPFPYRTIVYKKDIKRKNARK